MKLTVLQRVRPRTAGNVTVLIGLVAAVVSGFLIAHPPLSIPGAVLLVAATILLCVGAIWRLKKSWSDPWPPYTAPHKRKQLRRLRILFIATCVFLPVLLALSVFSVVDGRWWDVVFGLFLASMQLMNLRLFARAIKVVQRQPDPAADS